MKKMGATVKAVCDGAEAVEEVAAAAARGKTYSVVLMDCQVRGWGMGDGEGAGAGLTHACSQMPRLDGYSATQRIREEEKASASGAHLFIVALTAHAMASDVQKCLSVGMDAYLTKPLNSDKLILAFESMGILKPKAEEVKGISVAPLV